jgi:hypothetical protein
VASAWGLRFCRRAMALSFSRAVTSIRIDMGTVVEVIEFGLVSYFVVQSMVTHYR